MYKEITNMKQFIKFGIGVVSFFLGFILLKSVESFSDLLLLIFGIILILLIPGALIGPIIAGFLSGPMASFYFPNTVNTLTSEKLAHFKVAQIKKINYPNEAIKDFKLMIEKWPNFTDAYISVFPILCSMGEYEDAEFYYNMALNSVNSKEKEKVKLAWMKCLIPHYDN